MGNSLILISILIFALIVSQCVAVDVVKPVDNEKKLVINIYVPEYAIPSIYNIPNSTIWLNDTFLSYKKETPEGFELIAVEPDKKQKTVLCTESSLAEILAGFTGKKVNNSDILFSSLVLNNDMTIEVQGLNKTWNIDLKTKVAKEIDNEETDDDGSISPGCNYTVFEKDKNLWLKEKGKQGESQLTYDGSSNLSYYPSYIHWSPDSSRFVAMRIDSRNITTLPLLDSSPADNLLPEVRTVKIALPGDTNVLMEKPIIFDVKTGGRVPFRLPQVNLTMIGNPIMWSEGPRQNLYYLTLNRGEKNATFFSINPDTGEPHVLIQENSSSYYEPNLELGEKPNIRILKDGKIIWFSERSGWAQLYLYDNKGTLIRPITNGTFVVREIKGVDEENKYIYFTAGGKEPGRDPYYQHLYRVHIDGSNLTLLTPEDADHYVTFSPNLSYFIDTYSRVDLPPETVLRSSDGSLIMDLEKADISEIQKKGWTNPEMVKTVAGDGKTGLYGLIIKPVGFNKNERYPVIEAVYPGPFNIITPKTFPAYHDLPSGEFWIAQTLANLGFIVVFLDGRGTAYRDKNFHDVSYGHMGDVGGISDHVTGLQQLALNRSWMDLSRVGIYGHSGGGFMTAQALLTYPDFYDVGVASAGNYDNRLYNSLFVEKYQGYPVNTTSYYEQVTGIKAKNLKGHLLLITGDVDDNVNPSMTMQFAASLIKEKKMFDMLVLPGKDHRFFFDSYYLSRMYSYFVEHLLNKDPVMYVIPTQDPSLLAEYGGSFNNLTEY